MKVNGEIDVYIKEDGVIVNHIHTTNTFTNIGRQMICNWMMHDNYSADVYTPGDFADGGGRSLSAMKMVPYNEITPHCYAHEYNGNPALCIHPMSSVEMTSTNIRTNHSDVWTNKDFSYGTIFYEFSSPKDLVGLMIKATTSDGHYNADFMVAVSSGTYAQNTGWSNVGTFMVTNSAYEESSRMYREQFIRFRNTIDCPDTYNTAMNNVKTIRLAGRCGTNGGIYVYIYGLWFFESNFYPNNPSVIALGTSESSPTVDDIAMGGEDNRGWMMQASNPTNNKVKYIRHLEADEAAGVTFKEVGLFACPTAGRVHGGANGPAIATSLVARGLFDTPWSKTDSQTVDIEYTLTLS